MKSRIAMALLGLGLALQVFAADEPVTLVKITDYDGTVSYAVKSAAELKAMQYHAREDARYFAPALAEARKAWSESPSAADMPFPAMGFSGYKVATVGTPFPDRAKAQAKADGFQEKEDIKRRKLSSDATTAADIQKERLVVDAQDLLRRKVKEIRQQAEAKAAEAQAVAAATGRAPAVGGVAGGARVMLDALLPVASEWGTEPHSLFPDMKSGPMVCDWMSNGNSSPNFWPNNVKIISRANMAKSPIPEGQTYSSTMTNCFVVGGEYAAGVGLWARRMTFYHWLEYQIPAKATIFTGDVFVTDDAMGQAWWHPIGNQQFGLQVLVDGKEVGGLSRVRTGLQPGSGELLEAITIPLPPGAKRIRFRLANSGWGDGNCNTELLISNGGFLL